MNTTMSIEELRIENELKSATAQFNSSKELTPSLESRMKELEAKALNLLCDKIEKFIIEECDELKTIRRIDYYTGLPRVDKEAPKGKEGKRAFEKRVQQNQRDRQMDLIHTEEIARNKIKASFGVDEKFAAEELRKFWLKYGKCVLGRWFFGSDRRAIEAAEKGNQ